MRFFLLSESGPSNTLWDPDPDPCDGGVDSCHGGSVRILRESCFPNKGPFVRGPPGAGRPCDDVQGMHHADVEMKGGWTKSPEKFLRIR